MGPKKKSNNKEAQSKKEGAEEKKKGKKEGNKEEKEEEQSLPPDISITTAEDDESRDQSAAAGISNSTPGSSSSSSSGTSTDAHPKNRGSPASSLRSKTFDLREFNGMEPELCSSSSASVADTIIARGVEYKPHNANGGLRVPKTNKSAHPSHHQQHHNNVNVIVQRSKSESVLQPEEFLHVDPNGRHYVKKGHHHHQQHQQQSQQQQYPKREFHQRDKFVLDHFDEDRISIVNYKYSNPPPQEHPHHRHHHHHQHHHPTHHNRPIHNRHGRTRSPPTFALRMADQNFSPINYYDPNVSSNSLRSVFENDGDYRSWRENAPDSDYYPKHHTYRNGWHHPDRQVYQKREEDDDDPSAREPENLTFFEVIEKSLFGNAPLISEFLGRRVGLWYWWPVIFLECFLRSIGAVSFANNPLTGFIIFVVMLVVKPITAALGALALTSGILTALFLVELPVASVRGGGVGLNAFLMGVVIGELSDVTCGAVFCIAIMAGVVIVFIYCGLEGLVRNTSLPLLNAPFNLGAFIYFTCGLGLLFKSEDGVSVQGVELTRNGSFLQYGANISRFFGNVYEAGAVVEGMTGENSMDMRIDWVEVLVGLLTCPSQFYAVNTLWSSAIVFISWLIFSPTMALQALLGAGIGSLVGAALDRPPYKLLYNGGWSYNSLFTCSALGGLFYLLNIKSWILSVIGAILSALVFGAFMKGGLPIFGIPFMLVTWLLLFLSHLDEHKKKRRLGESMYSWFAFFRIPNDQIQTPEAHLQLYCKNQFKPGTVAPNNTLHDNRRGVPGGELHL